MKTKKVVSKRFKITKNGKIIRGRQMGRHLRINKNKTHQRRLKEPGKVAGKLAKSVRRFLPYGQ
ncbi:MAG: 50S ribosomal protein L35 [Patescibacteria group bacterium]|nr:50S ribosomal protein L35 [Patescibacteria group bacterium]MCL5095412.1 50S ribosomal protein L35 [Patescibacteria group bacterium]